MKRAGQINGMRRKLAVWVPASVIAVSLPAHAVTSPVVILDEPPTGGPDPTCIDCDDIPDESGCADHKEEVCHYPAKPGTDPFEICIAKPAVPAHRRLHGDYLGQCD